MFPPRINCHILGSIIVHMRSGKVRDGPKIPPGISKITKLEPRRYDCQHLHAVREVRVRDVSWLSQGNRAEKCWRGTRTQVLWLLARGLSKDFWLKIKNRSGGEVWAVCHRARAPSLGVWNNNTLQRWRNLSLNIPKKEHGEEQAPHIFKMFCVRKTAISKWNCIKATCPLPKRRLP